jgi:hypothetical protein
MKLYFEYLTRIGAVALDHAYLLFYLLLAGALVSLDWSSLNLPMVILVLLGSALLADFLSGIWHLFIDFYPLNHHKGVDRVFFYKGDRNSEEFLRLSADTFAQISWLDRLSYKFKIHHVKPMAVAKYGFNQVFLDNAVFAFIPLLLVIADRLFLQGIPAGIALALLLMGFFFANIEFIHSCVHQSPRFPRGRKIIRFFQQLRLIYPTEVHTSHHRGDGVGFCFITGHANFLVNRICGLLLRHGVVTDARWHGHP